ncbi:unknown [Lachnospiraceae bacterium CAG:215]|nr:unknown [Lachnospiraceae bacterium CAG:215]
MVSKKSRSEVRKLKKVLTLLSLTEVDLSTREKSKR